MSLHIRIRAGLKMHFPHYLCRVKSRTLYSQPVYKSLTPRLQHHEPPPYFISTAAKNSKPDIDDHANPSTPLMATAPLNPHLAGYRKRTSPQTPQPRSHDPRTKHRSPRTISSPTSKPPSTTHRPHRYPRPRQPRRPNRRSTPRLVRHLHRHHRPPTLHRSRRTLHPLLQIRSRKGRPEPFARSLDPARRWRQLDIGDVE